MNENEHIKVPNWLPIQARRDLPPHRLCSCPNSHIIGMSHSSLLQYVANVVSGDEIPRWSSTYVDVINELLYRGIIVHNMEVNWYLGERGVVSLVLPFSPEHWNVQFTMREGFALPGSNPK